MLYIKITAVVEFREEKNKLFFAGFELPSNIYTMTQKHSTSRGEN